MDVSSFAPPGADRHAGRLWQSPDIDVRAAGLLSGTRVAAYGQAPTDVDVSERD